MNKANTLFTTLLLLTFFINTSFTPYGCTDIIKTSCVPSLSPYLHNGQINSAILEPGEHSSTVMSFYSGNTYRLSTCAKGNNENIYFEVLSPTDGKVLYSSAKQLNSSWDFKVESSRKLVINVHASSDLPQATCAGLTVGFLQ